MAFLRQIALPEGFRNIPPITIDLAPAPGDANDFRHLIVTGPNGSGKSSLLTALMDNIRYASARLVVGTAERPGSNVELDWTDAKVALQTGRMFAIYLPARRTFDAQHVAGPAKLSLEVQPFPARLDGFFLQFLVNLKTEQAYAGADDDQAAVERIQHWFDAFTRHLRWLVDDAGLELVFDRTSFTFTLRQHDGFTFDFHTLADGYASVIAILAELLFSVDACQRAVGDRSFQPDGVVIIDEIETHLHLLLQEQILPFLTELMPRVQFVVATHSPAVIASIPTPSSMI